MWDVRDLGCSGYWMLGMWDVGDVGCWGCGMRGMWDVWDVGCAGCGMLIYKMPSPIARQVTSNEVNLILKISQQRKAVCCG